MEHRGADCVVSGSSILEYFKKIVFVTAIKKVITMRKGYSGVVATESSVAHSSQTGGKELELETQGETKAGDEEQDDILPDEDSNDLDDETDAEESATRGKMSAAKNKAKSRALQREHQYRHGEWKWKDSQDISPFGSDMTVRLTLRLLDTSFASIMIA